MFGYNKSKHTDTEVTNMEGLKIGIGRVSTNEQNPQRQIDAFLAEGIEERYIFIDKCTGNGGNLESREEYQRARTIARKGDTVYLDALDRLGRNTVEIEKEWRYFTEEVQCYMVVMNMPLLDTRPGKNGMDDISQLVSKIALALFSWMAQRETEERKRRQRGGIDAARAAGKYKGRKPVEVNKYEFEKLYEEVERGERTNKYVMDKLGLTRTTYYKLVGEMKEKKGRFDVR
jgi:DNA invertase Pin-like site-specific DNA recombinase